MKTLHVLLLFLSCAIMGCSSLHSRSDDPKFKDLTEKFLGEFWQHHKQLASEKGLLDFERVLEVPSQELFDKRLVFYKNQLEVFEKFDKDQLSVSQQMDLALIINELARRQWYMETFKEHQWNPSIYNLAPALTSVLEKRHRPIEERISDIRVRLERAGEYYQEAKKHIRQPTKEHLNLAIQQTQGTLSYLKNELRKEAFAAKLKETEKKSLGILLGNAEKATQNYLQFLRTSLKNPKSVGGLRDFRISPELYTQKFQYDLQIDLSPEELYQKALSAKEDARSRLFELAIELYPKFFGEALPPKDRQTVIQSVHDKLAAEHPDPKTFIETVRRQIPQLQAFVIDKDLFTMDESKPLQVRATPAYKRGFSGASIDSPGPYDPKRETFYNVEPLDDMSVADQKSYLREYNNYTLQILNIHEAIPGHYLQKAYSNTSKSLIPILFSNSPMVEGWAVYTERMMLEEGYGDQSPELWFMYYKWFLRVVTNTILDYEIHNKNLQEAKAILLMTEGAFQEKKEAQKKWRRATLSQVQLLSYFAGFSEIYQLREDIKAEKGESFDLKEFHETFLSYGNAPIREIRRLMMP